MPDNCGIFNDCSNLCKNPSPGWHPICNAINSEKHASKEFEKDACKNLSASDRKTLCDGVADAQASLDKAEAGATKLCTGLTKCSQCKGCMHTLFAPARNMIADSDCCGSSSGHLSGGAIAAIVVVSSLAGLLLLYGGYRLLKRRK